MTELRMKKKLMNQIHLGQDGKMVIGIRKSASDAASKGVSAQPKSILTKQETQGLPGGTSVSQSASTDEQGTGGSTVRISPENIASQVATSAGSMEGISDLESQVEGAGKSESAPVPPHLGDITPSAPSISELKDPNGEKETTVIKPNLGEGKVVGKTISK